MYKNTNKKIAWKIPATGVLPPALILVAVRAIAPVAGIPPKIPEAIFATPCPTNSWFNECLCPIKPSATTADSKASIPAKNAIVNADGTNSRISSNEKVGHTGVGRPSGRLGKRLPIVSTGIVKKNAIAEINRIDTRYEGILGDTFLQIMIVVKPKAPKITA